MAESEEFDVCYCFFKENDKNGSTTWSISHFEIEINYYYNDPKLNLNETLYKLSEIAGKVGLQHFGWKKLFVMQITKPP